MRVLEGNEVLPSIREMARITGRSEHTVKKWRTGENEIGIVDLARLFKLLSSNSERVKVTKMLATRVLDRQARQQQQDPHPTIPTEPN